MAHCNWTYVGDNGRHHKIGLFHGNRNGHVMIYVNMKVMVVDFTVTKSKVYSFFIEDEFCEIHLERKGDRMYYTFEINKKIDTPRNRIRKKTQNKYLKQTILFFGGMIFLAVLIGIGLNTFKERQEQKLYSSQQNLPITIARINEIERTAQSQTVHYLFEANGKTHNFAVDLEDFDKPPVLPLETGDEFQLQFDPKYPYRHQLFLDKPSDDQINRYFSRVIAKHLKLNPESYPELAVCELELIFQKYGSDAFSIYFNQDLKEEENPDFNQNSYLRLIRNPETKKLIRDNCF